MGLDNIRRIKEQASLPKEPKIYKIAKISKKKAEKMAQERLDRGEDDTKLQKWFKARIKMMKGSCENCGARFSPRIYRVAVGHIAHILPRRLGQFPSVCTHPSNWIELCLPCHQNLDNFWSWEDKAKLKIWPILVERITMMIPNISSQERSKLPDSIIELVDPVIFTSKNEL